MGHRWSFSEPTIQELAMRKFRYYYERTLRDLNARCSTTSF
jgi:hypothetical protein